MEMEDDESMPDINNSDNTTPDDTTNNQSLDNNNLQSTSSPQLSPRRKRRQTVTDESEMHPMTRKKSCRSNNKEQQSHSKSYKRLKKDIKEFHKDVSALTSIVCRMDDTFKKQSLELSEMKQMLKRLLQQSTPTEKNRISIDNKKTDWKDTTTHLNLWTEEDLEYYFNTVVADMRKCKIYVYDLMPNYVEKKLVDQAFEMPARCIASLAIAIGVNLHSK
ncbi:Ulp1-like peptidase [Cucumis melo var. makuwa]|uniref:Ulp1-like peptidase n=1 Tax=Cucumis melo var. makuwa TaxID=1194695 RepID=A0A5A7SXI1_CUCMM|nr:Ulp1-like peptidase [Cucumis melo var. makuwa]